MGKYCSRIEVIELNKLLLKLKLITAIFSSVPSQVYCYRSRRMQKMLRESDRLMQYDAIHVVCGRLAEYATDLRLKDSPVLLDWIDALSLNTRRHSLKERFWPKKVLYHWEGRKMRLFEHHHVGVCDYAIVTSPLDQEVLGKSRVETLPNGVDCECFAPRNVKKDIDLIFTGNMSYEPNIQAVDLFCKEILPCVQRRLSNVSFYVVGINPPQAVLKWSREPGIHVTGFVEDLANMLNRSRLFVAPMCSGSGIQNKILEALATGLPVLTTRYGNAALGGNVRSGVIELNTPAEFAQEIVSLLHDESRRSNLGRLGREMALRRFRWDSVVRRLEAIYVEISRSEVRGDGYLVASR